jgi:RHS repeat-associated protein
VANAFGTRAGSVAYQPVLDPRQDGVVNAGDLLLIAGKLLQECNVVAASAYNGDGLRIYLSENGATRRYTWDVAAGPSALLADSWGVTYEYGLEAILEERVGVATFYHQDGLDSTIMTTNAAGAVSGRYAYDVYGAPRVASPTLGFTGEQQDGSGLIYLRARSYDPSTGRLLTRDPVQGHDILGQTSHPYVYATDNPISLTDPTGMLSWKDVKAAAKRVLAPVVKPVVKVYQKYIAPVVKPVVQAVQRYVAPVVKPVAKVYQQYIAPVVKAVAQAVQPYLAPVEGPWPRPGQPQPPGPPPRGDEEIYKEIDRQVEAIRPLAEKAARVIVEHPQLLEPIASIAFRAYCLSSGLCQFLYMNLCATPAGMTLPECRPDPAKAPKAFIPPPQTSSLALVASAFSQIPPDYTATAGTWNPYVSVQRPVGK